ncbi:MAG: hypothetical protein Kow0026_25520 [Oricola sp.]
MAHGRPGGDGGASGAVYGSMAAAAVGGMMVLPLIHVAARVYWLLWPVTVPASIAYLAFGAFGDETLLIWLQVKLSAATWLRETAFLALTDPVSLAVHTPFVFGILAPVASWCGLFAFFWLRLHVGRALRRRRLARI